MALVINGETFDVLDEGNGIARNPLAVDGSNQVDDFSVIHSHLLRLNFQVLRIRCPHGVAA